MKKFLLLFLLIVAPLSVADDTGWVYATGSSSHDYNSGQTWVSAGNIYADDAVYATCAPPVLDYTDYLRGTFALTIPSGATINGIEVRYKAKRSAAGPEEISLHLVVGGVAAGTDGYVPQALPSTAAQYTRGGATSLWGLTPTRDQCVATDFGFQVAFEDTDSNVETSQVDSLSIKVYYTPAAAGLDVWQRTRAFFGG